ncbi:MAG: replication-relaxation family protein [Chloroflexota bacterium]|nr:replication-relaxation family protein [Chloroflexota bacterium]
MERELYDAIGDYLLAHIERHGHARTAEAFGVSRHTLWRFLERGQPGRALPRAVMAEAGDTPRKLRAATRALEGERRREPLERPRPQRLTPALRETLLLACEAPFASVEDLSRMKRLPASSLRERLSKLRRMGLAEAQPHRLAMLSNRPLRRYVPTAAGIEALDRDDVLYRHPVSRQWLRLLAERLDGVALLYELAAMIAGADPEEDPVRVEHCRSGPYDALITLSGGRTLGVVRQGAMLSSASLRYRLRTLERQDVQELPHVTLIATDSDQDTRRAVRALREPSGFHHSAVATLGAVIGQGARARVWQPARYGRGSTPVVKPSSSLAWLVDLAGREAEHPVHRVMPKRLWAWRSSGGARATPPVSGDLADAVATRLGSAEKRMLDLLAAWPLCTTEQLASFMGDLSERRANQLLRPLRRLGLVRREGEAHVLTDEGLAYLARRDRAAVGTALGRWSAERTEEGVFAGTALRALVSQREHQRGLAELLSMLSFDAALSRDHVLLDLLPTHRSQITYRHDETNYAIHPDASFQLAYRDEWNWYLLEYERRAVTPKRLPERLASYARYFGSGRSRLDHGGRPPMVLFVFETEHAEEVFLHAAARLPDLPLASATTESIGFDGPLGPAWRLPAPAAPERRRLHFLGEFPLLPSRRSVDFR